MKALLSLLFLHAALAENISSIVTEHGKGTEHEVYSIDLGNSFIGVPYGSSVSETNEILGEPFGSLKLDSNNEAKFYRMNCALIFTDQKLTGIRVGAVLFDFFMTRSFSDHRGYSNVDWKLNNGIQYGASLEKVQEIIGDNLISNDPRGDQYKKYEDGAFDVHLNFSGAGGLNENQIVTSLLIIKAR